jgi:ubiquinone/menaquinone biosynthesis C-methylase UbiE
MEYERPAAEYNARANLLTTGFTDPELAERYDRARPRPPKALFDLLEDALGHTPHVVVDLAAGTGLSTLPWAARAERVYGIEPSEAMRRVALRRAAAVPNVEFHDGTAQATGLGEGSADIVTCAQALHYLEPDTTFTEIARVLRPGGVFVAYDYDWMPRADPTIEHAYRRYRERLERHWLGLGLDHTQHLWDKAGHLTRMTASGHFEQLREVTLVSEDLGSVARLLDLARSVGENRLVSDAGVTDEELELPELEAAARDALGDDSAAWIWTYRVRIGIRT